MAGVQPGRWWPIVAGFVAVAAWLAVVARAPAAPPRCAPGLQPLGARCCGEGQRLEKGACVGPPTRCAVGMTLRVTPPSEGCAVEEERVRIRGGESWWRPPDTSVGSGGEHAITRLFAVDRAEVIWARWSKCVDERVCPALAMIDGGDPGQAAHGVTREEARTFCAWAGGHLPREAEWLRMAIGDAETRYPWGDADALCLRAAYGLVDGPCAHGARAPDTAGAHPWGATPSGVLDVAGNVSEWVDDGEAPAGKGVVRGGSFEDSESAPQRARWRRVVDVTARYAWVGFRCAYDVTDELTP